MINTLICLFLPFIIFTLPEKPPKITDELMSKNIGLVLLELETGTV